MTVLETVEYLHKNVTVRHFYILEIWNPLHLDNGPYSILKHIRSIVRS